MFIALICFSQAVPEQLINIQAPRLFISEAPWWQPYVPVFVGFVQFLLLAALTAFIFWSNSVQKIREREAGWYQKVVVDHAVERLKELFGELQKRLFEAAEQVEAIRNINLDQARVCSKRAIADAKVSIFELRSEMGFRLASFDAKLEQDFTIELENIENQLVKWFTEYPERHSYDELTSLPHLLTVGKIRLLRLLMSHEFQTWGLALPWSRRGGLPKGSWPSLS